MLRIGAFVTGTYGVHLEMGVSTNGAGFGMLIYLRWPSLEVLAALLILSIKLTVGEIAEVMNDDART